MVAYCILQWGHSGLCWHRPYTSWFWKSEPGSTHSILTFQTGTRVLHFYKPEGFPYWHLGYAETISQPHVAESQEPFTTLLPEHVFNCALFLWLGQSRKSTRIHFASPWGPPDECLSIRVQLPDNAVKCGSTRTRFWWPATAGGKPFCRCSIVLRSFPQ